VSEVLKNPKDVVKAVSDLLSKNISLLKEIEGMQKEKAMNLKKELKEALHEVEGVTVLGKVVPLDGGSIKDILFQLKGEHKSFFGVLGGVQDDKCTLSIILSDDLVKDRGMHAGNMVREVSAMIQGGGGG